jgi:hypothetical protein
MATLNDNLAGSGTDQSLAGADTGEVTLPHMVVTPDDQPQPTTNQPNVSMGGAGPKPPVIMPGAGGVPGGVNLSVLSNMTPPATDPSPVARDQSGPKPPITDKNATPDSDQTAQEVFAQGQLGLKDKPDFSNPEIKIAITKALGDLPDTDQQRTLPGPPVVAPGQQNTTGKTPAEANIDYHLQQQAEDADTLAKLQHIYGPSTSFDSSQTMPPWVSFRVGRALGQGNPIDADTEFHRTFPNGDLVGLSWGSNDPSNFFYRENPALPFKPIDNLPTQAGTWANWQNAASVGLLGALGPIESKVAGAAAGITAPALRFVGKVGAALASPVIVGGSSFAGNYLDYLTDRAIGLQYGSQEVYRNSLQNADRLNQGTDDYNRITGRNLPKFSMDQMQQFARDNMSNANIDYGQAAAKAWPSVELAALPFSIIRGGTFAARYGLKGLTGAANMIRGRGSVASMGAAGRQGLQLFQSGVDPQAAAVSQWAEQQGMPPLTVGQAHKSTLVKAIARQAGVTTGKMRSVALDQMAGVKRVAEGLVAQNRNAATDPRLVKNAIQAERDQLMAQIPLAKIGFSQVGETIQGNLRAWHANSKEAIRVLGVRMGTLAGDKWLGIPMGPVREVAERMKKGVWAPGRFDLDENGNEIDDTGTGAPRNVQVQGPSSEIRPILDRILKVGDTLRNVEETMPNGTKEVFNAAEQWQALEGDLYRLMRDSPNSLTRRQAFQLREAFMNSLRQGASEISTAVKAKAATKEFQDAYNRFADANGQFRDDEKIFRSMINAKDPGQFANAIVRPGKAATLAQLKSVLNAPNASPEMKQAWQAIQDGFRSRLEEDPTKVPKILDDFKNRDQAALDLVMPRAEQDTWRTLAENINELNESYLATEGSTRGRSPIANATEMARNMPAAEIAQRVAQTGGKAGDFATSIRAGFWNDVMSQAIVTDEHGIQGIDPRKFVAGINRYASNMDRLSALSQAMTIQDWQFVTQMRRYAAIAGGDISSIGGSMQQGQLVANFTNPQSLVEPERAIMALSKYLGAKAFSEIAATPIGRAGLTNAFGSGNQARIIRTLALLTSTATQKYLRPTRQEPAVLPDTQVQRDYGTATVPH